MYILAFNIIRDVHDIISCFLVRVVKVDAVDVTNAINSCRFRCRFSFRCRFRCR